LEELDTTASEEDDSKDELDSCTELLESPKTAFVSYDTVLLSSPQPAKIKDNAARQNFTFIFLS
jgi:hypothetical protein